MNGDALRTARDRLSTARGALDMNGGAFREVRVQVHTVRDAMEEVRGALHIDGGTVCKGRGANITDGDPEHQRRDSTHQRRDAVNMFRGPSHTGRGRVSYGAGCVA
jgi:hypothetical protein